MSANRHRASIASAVLAGVLAVLATSAASKEGAKPPSLSSASAAQVAAAPSLTSSSSSGAAASAIAAPSPATSAAAQELTQLQDQTVVLQAKLKELEARQAVDARLQALKGASSIPSLGNIRVVAIEGMGATRIATLRLSDGSEFEAAPGDTIADGMRVAAIERGAVTIRSHNGKLMRLRVGSTESVAGADLGDTPALPANTLGGVTMAPRIPGRAE